MRQWLDSPLRSGVEATVRKTEPLGASGGWKAVPERLHLCRGKSSLIGSCAEMDGIGIVEATERLYRSLFTVATAFVVGSAAWGVVLAPFNGFSDHHGRSVVLGAVLVTIAGIAFWHRKRLYEVLGERHVWLFVVVALAVAALWIDGGWRSSYYLFSYAAIALAAVTTNLRWSLTCAGLLLAGYVGGLILHGYTWNELKALNDADSVVANSGGYLIAAVALSIPVSWLGGYVARINQVIGSASEPSPPGAPERHRRLRTRSLSVREVEVAQLVAAGMTNGEIATRLVLSDRTVQSHVRSAMRKAGAKNRAELAAIAVREGLIPTN